MHNTRLALCNKKFVEMKKLTYYCTMPSVGPLSATLKKTTMQTLKHDKQTETTGQFRQSRFGYRFCKSKRDAQRFYSLFWSASHLLLPQRTAKSEISSL